MIIIKVKVIKISGIKKVIIVNGEKCKVECFFSDLFGIIILIFWEDKINEVSEGKIYIFYNVRVIKEYKFDKLVLGIMMYDCIVLEVEDFIEFLF